MKECPHIDRCKYAEKPACQLDTVIVGCREYIRRQLKDDKLEIVDERPHHFANQFNRFKGVNQ